MKRALLLMIGLVLALAALPAFAAEGAMPVNPPAGETMTLANPPAGEAMSCPMHQMSPEARQHMMSLVQGLLTMTQNTAVWTPQGLYVLQGNRVLQYDTNLVLRRQAMLPLMMPTATTATIPPAGGMAAMPPLDLASLVPTKLIPTENGVIVVRGQQVIRLNTALQFVNVAVVPALPPMTPAETAAACPLCGQLAQMMAMGMMGMPGTDVAAAPTTTMPPGHQP